MIARKPLAPVLRSRDFFATSSSASSSKSSSTPSSSNNLWYCLVSEFFGSFRILISAFSSSASRVTTTGTRPINSGIRPNLIKSSGITSFRISPTFLSSLTETSAPKPMDLVSCLDSMIFSIPSKAPPQINRIFVVSIWRNSWWGCLRPPWGGTLATVPSRIFRSACCTPSPETSRVMDGFSDFLVILSISSI